MQRAIALSSASFNFFHSAFFTLFPFYALNTLDLLPTVLGLVVSTAGFAGLGAATFAKPMINRMGVPRTLISSLFVVLPFSLLIRFGVNAVFPYNAILIIIAFAARDFTVMLNLVIKQAIRQATVRPTMLSRISATQRFCLGHRSAWCRGRQHIGDHRLRGRQHPKPGHVGHGRIGVDPTLATRAVRRLPQRFEDAAG